MQLEYYVKLIKLNLFLFFSGIFQPQKFVGKFLVQLITNFLRRLKASEKILNPNDSLGIPVILYGFNK